MRGVDRPGIKEGEPEWDSEEAVREDGAAGGWSRRCEGLVQARRHTPWCVFGSGWQAEGHREEGVAREAERGQRGWGRRPALRQGVFYATRGNLSSTQHAGSKALPIGSKAIGHKRAGVSEMAHEPMRLAALPLSLQASRRGNLATQPPSPSPYRAARRRSSVDLRRGSGSGAYVSSRPNPTGKQCGRDDRVQAGD